MSTILFLVLTSLSVNVRLSKQEHHPEELVSIESLFDDISGTYNKYTKHIYHSTPKFFGSLTLPFKFSHKHSKDKEYDFIIVGCGTSGSVIANRLSQYAKWNILVLEAGKIEHPFFKIPLFSKMSALYDQNWHYLMKRDDNFAKGMKNQRIGWHSGKVVGGSSAIGDMVYSRGISADYDAWASQGNPGWSYRDVLPYFLRSEQSNLKHEDSRFHNHHGEQSIEEPFTAELGHAFVAAGAELGYPKYIDYNSDKQYGFATLQATLHKGRRQSAASAFVYPIIDRPNLDVVINAYVTKILINAQTKQAYGVRYVKHKKEYEVHCRKEIILSSGTFNSPKLLMLSGIGPNEHLKELGIETLVDLPVGETIYDQVAYMALNFQLKVPLSAYPARIFNPAKIKKYFETGEGPLSTLGFTEGLAFVKTNASRFTKNPDVELKLLGATIGSDYGTGAIKYYRIRHDMYNYYFAPFEIGPAFSIVPVLIYPKSKGFMKLHSKDPHHPPLLYGNYFSDPQNQDVKTMIEAIRISIRLTQTKAFQKYGTNMDTTPVPGCEEHSFDSDLYWECAIRTFSSTHFMPAGTNKMGPQEDPNSVVNHDLKVHGIERLRVVDCSVIPVTLSAHLIAPALMIGEKASDVIKHHWHNHTFH